jgi:hypothetical protein
MVTRVLAIVVILAALAFAAGGPADPGFAASGISIDPPPAAAEAKLDAVLKEVRFDQKPLGDALEAVRQQGGINLVVAWDEFDGRFTPQKPVDLRLADVPVRDALAAMLIVAGLHPEDFRIVAHGNVVYVGGAEFRGSLFRGPWDVTVRIYDVADILVAERKRRLALQPYARPEPDHPRLPVAVGVFESSDLMETGEPTAEQLVDALSKMLMKEVDADAWGDRNAIREYDGRLFIEQTPANHRRIEALLAALRKTA